MDYQHNRLALPNFLTSSLFVAGYSFYDSVFLPQYQKLLKTRLKPVLLRLCFAEHPIYLPVFQFDQYSLIKAFRNLLQVLRHCEPRNKSCISISNIQWGAKLGSKFIFSKIGLRRSLLRAWWWSERCRQICNLLTLVSVVSRSTSFIETPEFFEVLKVIFL